MRKTDLGIAFETFKNEVFAQYRGYQGTRENGMILWKGVYHSTQTDFERAVDTYIREGGIKLGNSIKSNK